MKTPSEPPVPQEQTFTAEGKLGSDGTYTGHIEQQYRGDVEVVLRTTFRQVSQSQWKEATQRFSFGMGFGGEVSNVTISPPEETGKPFRIAYDYTRKGYSDWENQRVTPPLPPMGIESNKDSKKPSEDVVLGALGEVVYRSRLTLPPGYVTTAPKGVDIVKPYAEYHATASLENGVIATSRRLVIKKHDVPLADWEDYRDFGKAVSDDEFRYLYLTGENAGVSGAPPANIEELDAQFREGNEALQKRDFTRAEELYRKVIAGNAKYHGAHFNLGLALASENKMEDAIAEFRKEQEVTPNEVRAYGMAAMYLTFRARRDEAIEEWRKLLKVDPGNHDAALNLSGMLGAQGKDADAVVVLEAAAKESPDSPSLEMALGQAYVKTGQADKGVAHFRKAIESTSDPKGITPGMLNNAAYTLAESSSHLDLAKEYAEKAVAQLDAKSMEASDFDDAGVRIGGGFTEAWDTLGWIYFLTGDANRAESFVHASWMLRQDNVVGDHLAQIYEKLGKKKEAEHVYEQALAAGSLPRINFSPPDPFANQKAYQASHDQILAHYQKLTGHKFSQRLETRRLPNGEWTKTPGEKLRDAQRVKISKTTSLSGTAQFAIVFVPGKVEAVQFLNGVEDLKAMTEKLKMASYPMEFPVGSRAKIARRVLLICKPSEGCTADLSASQYMVVPGMIP